MDASLTLIATPRSEESMAAVARLCFLLLATAAVSRGEARLRTRTMLST